MRRRNDTSCGFVHPVPGVTRNASTSLIHYDGHLGVGLYSSYKDAVPISCYDTRIAIPTDIWLLSVEHGRCSL